MLLSKGFEIEIYTGTPAGEIVGLSDRIVAGLPGFVREPDSRNVEYTTAPLYDYDRLLCALVRPRMHLRSYLQHLGNYTLVPGSTLSLGSSDRFYRSDPSNPYHEYIERTYGTRVVTASVHMNIGVADPEQLMRAYRLARVEAPLYLALSASSPFLDGRATGYHSTRWGLFPQTPARVPLFVSHQHYIDWTEEQLVLGTMQNVRHLWLSARPNGDCRPYKLNRLELRICDLVVDPIALLAIAALLEARVVQLLGEPDLDPLTASKFDADAILDLIAANEQAVARDSLDADLQHWQDGRYLSARDWIAELYPQAAEIARQGGYLCFLSPLKKLLREGNAAQRWLHQYASGSAPQAIVAGAIRNAEQHERELESKLCPQLMAA
ncbi:glutamate--cysteine ligase [Rubidibacter lacunae KORDI 51-2]|uniref:Glutamate--cysteine ligase n=1 Tax=Rubidibacter lacunae KORDI 51-2 TaxID=582515 RepID=U5DNB6_9CHRO|nr:glutamate--cysteine ligase [Rubidibacter lacunae]ERN41190.1 glutamate--cysteine ligase [Rubidibacter lacunae KORDI 51-2]